MNLVYYEGKNFGDALNPIIFHHFLPEFFDDEDDEVFFGIGSILGRGTLKSSNAYNATLKHVFSSGFAYGKLPVIDSSYNVICVRGPLTAKALKLPGKKVIADGALLLKNMVDSFKEKTIDFTFIPHYESEYFYDWKLLTDEVGIHYLSPQELPHVVISTILKSKVVITEAMHGAIVADTLGIPWVPIKIYEFINEFKWIDWLNTTDLKYEPVRLTPLKNEWTINSILDKRGIANRLLRKSLISGYSRFQYLTSFKRNIRELEIIKKEARANLSCRSILNNNADNLFNELMKFALLKQRIY